MALSYSDALTTSQRLAGLDLLNDMMRAAHASDLRSVQHILQVLALFAGRSGDEVLATGSYGATSRQLQVSAAGAVSAALDVAESSLAAVKQLIVLLLRGFTSDENQIFVSVSSDVG